MTTHPPQKKLTAIDVFAGCGGLSVGLLRAGFAVASAIELDRTAHATYVANHTRVHAPEPRDIRAVTGDELIELAGGQVDLIAGCPPCQGFCSLTSKKGRNDPRNLLVGEFARLIREVRPRAVMMENVPGLVQRGREIFDELVALLEDDSYLLTFGVLQVADFGVPQRRRRLVLLAGRGFEIPLPRATHSKDDSGGLPKWRSLRDAITGLPKPVTLSQAKRRGGPRNCDWHVVRDMSAANVERIRHARAGNTWRTIPKRLRPQCHKSGPLGFRNAYGRMRWNEPAVTITGGCTTLSKGRFGHPQANRTISVREAALLQTFPPDYVFASDHIDKVCTMIGNALPCDFAEVLARVCSSALSANGAKG